jgi:acetyl-CoA C-acetyltransferase
VRERHPELDPAGIDDVVLGIVGPVGDQGGVLPRTAALAGGLPEPVAGIQLNRYCGSGLEAVNQAAARLRSGWEDLIIAGGVESMSRVAKAWANGHFERSITPVKDPSGRILLDRDEHMRPAADLAALVTGRPRSSSTTPAGSSPAGSSARS